MNNPDGLRTCSRHAAVALYALGALALVALAGCGPIHLVANTNIPAPLITKFPIGVALFIPTEFAHYVHKEDRWNTDWEVDLGTAQSEGITRLMTAMFERVQKVDSINAGTRLGEQISAILEPSIEEYAFVTPRDAGSPFFAVSIKYRVNVYLPDGKLADSWGFTGYGTSPSEGLSSEGPLATATALAMRDAGAKLAVEFREQPVLRGLLPQPESADTPPKVITDLPSPSELAGSSDPAHPSGQTGPLSQASPSPRGGSAQSPSHQEAGPGQAASSTGASPASAAPADAAPSGEAQSSSSSAPADEAPLDDAATGGASTSSQAVPSQGTQPSSGEAEPSSDVRPPDSGEAGVPESSEVEPPDSAETGVPESEKPE